MPAHESQRRRQYPDPMNNAYWSQKLRKTLNGAAQMHAEAARAPYYHSLNENEPTILFEPYDNGNRHGNFQPESYAAILERPEWLACLERQHPCPGALPHDRRHKARETDSATSSAALLMNIFCFPGILDTEVVGLLGCSEPTVPQFEYRPHVPLSNGDTDWTCIDMKVGSLLCEAKLTEPDFTTAPAEKVERYAHLFDVFERRLLPRSSRGDYCSYQLIRNVLAAYHSGDSFVLICDARRPDLLHDWWEIARAIRIPSLRAASAFLTWQEIILAAPETFREFVGKKCRYADL